MAVTYPSKLHGTEVGRCSIKAKYFGGVICGESKIKLKINVCWNSQDLLYVYMHCESLGMEYVV